LRRPIWIAELHSALWPEQQRRRSFVCDAGHARAISPGLDERDNMNRYQRISAHTWRASLNRLNYPATLVP